MFFQRRIVFTIMKEWYRKSYFDNRVRRNEVCLSDDQRFDAPKRARDLDKETSLTGWNWFFFNRGIRLFSEIQQL